MATEPTENLLTSIYRLTRDTEYAHTKEIAEALGVSQPTVSEKIGRLADQGLLDYRWREGVALTEEGRIAALKTIRKHRLIETFLVNFLHYPVEDVDEEACRLEHAVSDKFTDALEAVLDYPSADPHGHPIPDKEGALGENEYFPLSKAALGSTVRVRQLSDRDKDQLQYLYGLGIIPDASIMITDIAPFDGPVSLSVEGKTVVISREMARKIEIFPDEAAQ
jgi:DtxR family Mn-dependent transcriptional regulator